MQLVVIDRRAGQASKQASNRSRSGEPDRRARPRRVNTVGNLLGSASLIGPRSRHVRSSTGHLLSGRHGSHVDVQQEGSN